MQKRVEVGELFKATEERFNPSAGAGKDGNLGRKRVSGGE